MARVRRRIGALVAVLALATTSAVALVTAPSASANHASICDGVTPNRVQNCGFETGSYPPWVQGGDTSFSPVQGIVKHSGAHAAQLSPAGTGTLSQTLTELIPGTSYEVSFYLYQHSSTYPNTNSFTASMTNVDTGGGVSGTNEFVTLNNVGEQTDWNEYVHTVTPLASSSTLTFTFQNQHGNFVLDDVVVTPAGGGTTTSTSTPTTTSTTMPTTTTSTTMPTTTTSTTMPTTTTSTTMPTTTTSTTRPTGTTSTTVVSPPPSLFCQRDVVDGTSVIECRIVDRDGIRRINVTDLTTREREQSIPFPRGHIITAAHFNIADDGNSHRVHLNDAAGNVHVWFVGPDGTVTPKTT